MSDPTLHQAERICQALELEYRMNPSRRQAELVMRARILVDSIKTAREADKYERDKRSPRT
jgi:hypothetical protein